MTFKVETHYEKNGQQVQLKTPKARLLGKVLDEKERHTFKVLADEIKEYTNGNYPSYQLYVKYPDAEQAFVLDLGKQAWGLLSSLQLKIGDLLTVWKEMKTNDKTGAIMPVVAASVVKADGQPTQIPPGESQNASVQQTIASPKPAVVNAASGTLPTIDQSNQLKPGQMSVEQYTQAYVQQVKPVDYKLNEFVGCYLVTNCPDSIKQLMEAFNGLPK